MSGFASATTFRRTMVIVKYRVEGFHAWKDAPPKRAYLADRHRHMFHIEAGVTVSHNDRDVEFHDLLDFCKSKFNGGELGNKSCEMVAHELLSALVTEYGLPADMYVSVFEDGEVGSIVTLSDIGG